MINPSLDVLVKQVDSKYTLVIMASKRAREIMSGAISTIKCTSNKAVTIALEEIANKNFTYERTKGGIK